MNNKFNLRDDVKRKLDQMRDSILACFDANQEVEIDLKWTSASDAPIPRDGVLGSVLVKYIAEQPAVSPAPAVRSHDWSFRTGEVLCMRCGVQYPSKGACPSTSERTAS
jgi:hypothetical protein